LSYSQRIGEILQDGVKNISKNRVRIIISHLFITGTKYGEDERNIELGGALAVNVEDLPEVDYIALGHIHRPMKFKKKRVVYSGSPIEYRINENRFDKKVFIVNLKGNLETKINEIELENYKPIVQIEVNSVEEGIKRSKEMMNSNRWIYLKINSHRPLENNEIREIKKNGDVIEITPIIDRIDIDEVEFQENPTENIEMAFINFYKQKHNNREPSKEMIEIFHKLLEEVE
jgi:exonuclease SbcD